MSFDISLGRGQQALGKLLELWGRATGDEASRMRGYQLVALGQLRVLGGQAAALLRYCTPRQALALAPALQPQPLKPGARAP